MMRLHLFLACAAAALALAGPASAASSDPSEPRQGWPEAPVEHRIVEDDGVRIEEHRERGETRRVTVQTKGQIKSRYEIVMPQHGGHRGALTGQRVWQLFSF